MCGIVGYIGPKDPVEVLIEGLRKREYRGYDSAGVAILDDRGTISIRRAPGKLRDLESVLAGAPLTGTYGLAVLAHENKVPFYVAAPFSTVDLSLADGDGIPIEQRAPEEVTAFAGRRIAPEGIQVAIPAFDVTPYRYVTAVVTERGIARAPYTESLAALVGATEVSR